MGLSRCLRSVAVFFFFILRFSSLLLPPPPRPHFFILSVAAATISLLVSQQQTFFFSLSSSSCSCTRNESPHERRRKKGGLSSSFIQKEGRGKNFSPFSQMASGCVATYCQRWGKKSKFYYCRKYGRERVAGVLFPPKLIKSENTHKKDGKALLGLSFCADEQ